MSIRHNSILTLIKPVAPFFGMDITYMIYLDVTYFSVVCLTIYYEKPAVKTMLTTMGYFFSKKLNYCPSDIICNSFPLKCLCLKYTKKILIHILTLETRDLGSSYSERKFVYEFNTNNNFFSCKQKLLLFIFIVFLCWFPFSFPLLR